MEFSEKRERFKNSPKRQIIRIKNNIKELRNIFDDLKNNSASVYRPIESSAEIVKIFKLLELERQVVEFNDILQEVFGSSIDSVTQDQEEEPLNISNQENIPSESSCSIQEPDQESEEIKSKKTKLESQD